MVQAPHRDLLQRAYDWLTTSWPIDVVITQSTVVALRLFEQGWDVQGQVALVIDPKEGIAGSALASLHVRRDWRTFDMAPPVIALIAPSVDGDGAQLTTSSPEKTEDIVGRLARAFSDAGIEFRTD